MGKVVLKIQKHSAVAKNGVATTSVYDVSGTVNMTIPSARGEVYSGEPTRTKNPRFAVENNVATLTSPQTEADAAGDKKIAIINPVGFDGTSVQVHAVVKKDGTNSYGPASFQVVNQGSGYSTQPIIKVKDKDDAWQTLTVGMGTGVFVDSDFDRLLLYENGRAVNHNELEFSNVKDSSFFKDLNSPENTIDFKAIFLTADERKDIVSIKPMNIYNHNLKLSDLGITQMGTLIATSRALDMVREQEKQIKHLNESAAQLVETTNLTFEGKTYETLEGVNGAIEEKAIADHVDALDTFQTNYAVDIGKRFNISTRGAPVDAVWQTAMLLISGYAKRLGPRFVAGGPNMQRLTTWLADPKQGSTTPSAAGFPAHPPSPAYRKATYRQRGSQIETPDELGYIKSVAKFFYWKTICMAAIGTIGGIFSRIMSSKKGVSTYKRSGGNVKYTARIWMPNDTDGMVVNWLKAEFAQHDLISIMGNIIDAIKIATGSLKDLALAVFPDKADQLEASRMEALLLEAHCAASIETLKSTYKNLNSYRKAVYQEFEYLKNEGAFDDSATTRQHGKDVWAREILSYLEYTLGKIELCLDAYAIMTDVNGSRYTRINLNEVLYWADLTTTDIRSKAVGRKLKSIDDGSRKATKLANTTTSKFIYAYDDSRQSSITNSVFGANDFKIYGLFKPSKNAFSKEPVLPTFSLTSDANGNTKINITNAGKNLGGRMLLRPAYRNYNLTQTGPTVGAVGINWMVYNKNWEEASVPDRQEAWRERQSHIFSNDLNNANATEVGNYLSNFRSLANFINTHGVETLGQFLDGSPTAKRRIGARGGATRTAPILIGSGWEGAKGTLSKIETYLKKKTGGNNELVTDMMVVDLIQPELGRCEDESIKVWDSEHAKVFFESPNAYNSTRKKSRIQESICKKTSCGVAQVYVTPPSIGEKTKVDTSGSIPTVVPDDVQTGPICGNVTLKYNLHPTTDLLIIGESRNFSLFTDSQSINKNLRISDSPVTAAGGSPFDKIRYGTHGDISMPAVFGNWALSFNNPKGNDKRGFGRKFLQSITNFAQLSNNKLDPRITAPISASMANLLEHYQAYRLYKGDSTTKGASASTQTALAPIKSVAAGDYWDKKDARNYYFKHVKSLRTAYEAVAQVTGKYSWDKDLVNSKDITPILTSEQKFSGVCYPVFENYGYAFKGWRTTLGEPIHLGAWGPTVNSEQIEEEQFVFRGGEKSVNGRLYDGLRVVNAAHLPLGPLPINNPNGTQDGAGVTEPGILANKKLYIPDRPYFAPLHRQAMQELQKLSTWIPRFDVRDITPIFRISKSGLPVGADSFTVGSGNISGMTLKEIEAVCMNVTGYKSEASSAHGKGYWKNPEGFAEPWDSRKLKEKYGVPYYGLTQAYGKSYISGQTGDGEAAAIANLTTNVNTYHEWVNNRHYTGAALVKNGARITGDTVHYATGNDDDSLSEAQDNAFATLASNLGSAWTTAFGNTDGDGNKLAVSGVHSTDTIISSYTHNIATHAGTWSPVTPTKYAENLPALKITGGGGTNNLATATADYLNKLRGKSNGSVRTAPLCGNGDTGPDARPNPTHLSSGLVPFQTSYNYTSATSCADAFAALKVLVEADSTTYYNTYGEGLAAGPTNFLTLTSSGCSGIGALTTHSNPLSTGWSTAGTLADAKNGGSNTNSWYARLSCSVGTLGTGDGSQIAELGMSGSASVDWPTQFSATGSTSGAAWTATKAKQLNIDAHQNTYWTTALSTVGSNLSVVNGTPADPGVTVTFFQTGAPTFTSGTTSLLYSPYDQNAPYEGHSASSSAIDWISNLFYTSAINNVASNNLCTIDTTASACSASEISSPSLDDIWSMHWQSGSHSTQANCYGTTLDTNASTYTNYLKAVSGVRRYMYDVIRKRLQEGSHQTVWSAGTLESALHSDQTFNRYNFSDIGSTLAVYPNSGALCGLEIPGEPGSSPIDFETDCDSPSYLGNQTASSADTNISTTSETRVRQIVNLKDWAPAGDIDIWILESTKHWGEVVYSGDCYNHTDDGGTLSNHYDGWIQRYLNEYHYRTAVVKPTDMSNISGSVDSAGANFTATAPVLNRTKFVKGTGVCSSYSQYRATGDASAPNFITGEARCENWNVNTKQAVVTGRIDSAVSVAITPLARNEYDGTIVVSGQVPVVTGKCSWSSNKRAIFKDDGIDSETKLAKQSLSGYITESEAYVLHYQNNYSGIYKPEKIKGQSESTVKSNKNPQGRIEFNSDQENDSLSKSIEAGDTYKRSDKFLVQAAIPGENEVPTYLMGGWERINQAASTDSVIAETSASNFGRAFVVTVDDKETNAVLQEAVSNKTFRRPLFGANTNPSSITIGNSKTVQKAIESKINNINLQSRKMGFITVKPTQIKNSNQGLKAYDVSLDAEGISKSTTVFSSKGPDEAVSCPVQILENEAAACQSCVTTDVTPERLAGEQEVVYMNENYIHGMQLDWELRSGNWEFTVPYMEAGKTIKYTDNGTEKEYLTQNWYDIVTDSFQRESADKYHNHYTLFGIPFEKSDTQLGCDLNDHKSQLDKIYDYQVHLNKEGATYRKHSEGGTHEIEF